LLVVVAHVPPASHSTPPSPAAPTAGRAARCPSSRS